MIFKKRRANLCSRLSVSGRRRRKIGLSLQETVDRLLQGSVSHSLVAVSRWSSVGCLNAKPNALLLFHFNLPLEGGLLEVGTYSRGV